MILFALALLIIAQLACGGGGGGGPVTGQVISKRETSGCTTSWGHPGCLYDAKFYVTVNDDGTSKEIQVEQDVYDAILLWETCTVNKSSFSCE
jgi:hypothetical protein